MWQDLESLRYRYQGISGGAGLFEARRPTLNNGGLSLWNGALDWMKGDNELSTNSYCHLFPDCRCSGTLLFTTPSHQDELYIINCELGRVFSLLSCSHRVFCHDSGKSKLWTVLPGCTASFEKWLYILNSLVAIWALEPDLAGGVWPTGIDKTPSGLLVVQSQAWDLCVFLSFADWRTTRTGRRLCLQRGEMERWRCKSTTQDCYPCALSESNIHLAVSSALSFLLLLFITQQIVFLFNIHPVKLDRLPYSEIVVLTSQLLLTY